MTARDSHSAQQRPPAGSADAPASGWPYIALGGILALVGIFSLAVDGDGAPPAEVGMILLAAAAIFGTIGTVAVGVTVGLQRADWLRRR